ncbi:MAG: DUF2460 domain-containing protein, partial [Pacificimonas sp.]
MTHYLARAADRLRTDWLKRFDAAYWTVNFPRPMMASAIAPEPGKLRVDVEFYRADDLAGIIWESEDRHDHPLLTYETRTDYRGLVLSFRWRASGAIKGLGELNGPVMTVEGRDANGERRAWYVRLWNYASGSSHDARIEIDFDDLDGGYLLPGEADPVWAGDIDRLFISLVPQSFDGTSALLPNPESGTVWIEEIETDGAGSTIAIGDAFVPPHDLRIATGYDDEYNLTPTRVLRNMYALGFRDLVTLYVGMSHYMQLAPGDDGLLAARTGNPLVAPCRVWMDEFARSCAVYGYEPMVSLSYELFDAYCPEEWKQRAHDGAPALTGWEPPSSLLSPANVEAMDWLKAVAARFLDIFAVHHDEMWFQVGEPWWWTGFGAVQVPCFYDDAANAAYSAETGRQLPERLTSLSGALSDEQLHHVAWLGGKLADTVLALADVGKGYGAKTTMLFYAPQVLRADAPWLTDVNMPTAFAAPAFDALQLEDYDFVIEEDRGGSRRARAAVAERLGYPTRDQHYFSGFVLNAGSDELWPPIAEAAAEALDRGVAETFVWALPQIRRDGFVWTRRADEGDEDMDAFHDVRFPLAVGQAASGGPEFLTEVAETVSGSEQRASLWAAGRLRFDAGVGVRSDADLQTLLRFFRARKGRAHGFR